MKRVSILVLCMAVLVVIASQALAASSLPVEDRAKIVSSSGGHFWVQGAPLRFIGYNIRGFVHYGGGDILPYASWNDRLVNGQVVLETGGKVIRVFGSNKHISNEELGNRLQYVLDLAESYGLYVLYAFTDYYNTGFNPRGDEKFYTSSGGYTVLNEQFFAGGFRENYLPQVRYLVNRFKNHKGLFAWQLGNEIKHYNNPQLFYNFCLEMHQAVREIDQNHMISIGLISTTHTGWNYNQSVDMHSLFDFMTIHPYHGEEYPDHDWANGLRKPLIIGEAGFGSGNRPALTSNDIAKWVGRGARGYLQWGLMATLNDNGDGDRLVGIDRVFHASDWDAYRQMYTNWAQQLSNTLSPAAEPTTGVTASEGLYNDRVMITWNFEPSAKEYAVFRATSPTGTKTQISSWQTGLAYADTTTVPGITHCYWVKARNNGGESGFGSYATGWVDSGQPGVLAGSVTDTQGNPIQGAGIFLMPGDISTTSQPGGSYTINNIQPGTYSVTVYQPGYGLQTASAAVQQGQTTTLNIVLVPVVPAAEIKASGDGAGVTVSGIVTAGFPVGGPQNRIYIQDPEKGSGIAVATATPVSVGDVVTVNGSMSTQDGERVVGASSLISHTTGQPALKPLAMSNRSVGGGSVGLQAAVMNDAASGGRAAGLNNTGVLIKTWGQVTYVDPAGQFFYINDGSDIYDGFGPTGIRVASAGLPQPEMGMYVQITGISGVFMTGGELARLLRPRSVSDLSYAEDINFVTNPGFETGNRAGWSTYDSAPNVVSGSWWAGIKANSGSWFVGKAADGSASSGGLYQRMPVLPGYKYRASVWSRVYRLNNPADSVQNRVGIDPTGGTNQYATTVQWSGVDTQPVNGYSEWKQLVTPEVVSSDGYVTIFLDARQSNPPGWHINCFDDAEVYVVD